MTAILDRVPTERIGERARAARPGVTLLRALTAVLFALGWAVARVLGLLWLAVAWMAIAVAEGWREGRAANGRRARTRQR